MSEELQAQVDDLNDERVRLLKKLRDGAASGALSTRSATGSGGGVGGGEDEGNVSVRSESRLCPTRLQHRRILCTKNPPPPAPSVKDVFKRELCSERFCRSLDISWI